MNHQPDRQTAGRLIIAIAAFAACASVAAWAKGEQPEAPVPAAPAGGRISVCVREGFHFLDGGYADPNTFYASLWDTGTETSLSVKYAFAPVFCAGLSAGFAEHRDRGLGIDDLHLGSVRAAVCACLPLALPSRFLLDADAVPCIRGFVLSAEFEAGLGLIDPTHDAYGRIFQRTLTWSVAAFLKAEYRLDEIGLFLGFGADLVGPPRPAPGRWQEPDSILSFPVFFGLALYFS